MKKICIMLKEFDEVANKFTKTLKKVVLTIDEAKNTERVIGVFNELTK